MNLNQMITRPSAYTLGWMLCAVELLEATVRIRVNIRTDITAYVIHSKMFQGSRKYVLEWKQWNQESRNLFHQGVTYYKTKNGLEKL